MTPVHRDDAPAPSLLQEAGRRCASALRWAWRQPVASRREATLVLIGEDGVPVAAEPPTGDGLDDLASAGEGGGDVAADGPEPGRSSSRELFHIVEEERMRIARDIHDGPAQLLANLVLKSEIVERLVASGSENAFTELADFRATTRLALEETRRLIFDLRPMSLDDLGLAATLRRFLADLEERSGIHTSFRLVGDERRLPTDLEGMIFRVMQEASNNAHRHASPRSIDVTLTVASGRVTATVRDDGCGFDVAAATARGRRTRHIGLSSMRERAALQGGVVDIASAPGRGTRVRVTARY